MIEFYVLGKDKTGYVGFFILFENEVNVSKYKRFEFAIQFEAKHKKIDLFLQDAEDTKDSVRITSTGQDIMDVSIELEEFADVNLTALKSIAFIVDTAFESGTQVIAVGSFRFVP